MKIPRQLPPLFVILLAAVVAAAELVSPLVPAAEADSCAQSPSNLILNGSMGPGSDPRYAQFWSPFIVSVPPSVYPLTFEWVDNEGWDPNGSQFIYKDYDPWDAGVYQTLNGLTPGATYQAWFIWGQTGHEVNGVFQHSTTMNRQLGVDPTGGTDPLATRVIWTVPTYGGSGFNRPEWNLFFTATGPQATLFLRVQNFDTTGRNKVFLDVICLYPATGSSTSTPWSTPNGTPGTTATPTRTPTPTPTSPLRPAISCVYPPLATINLGAGSHPKGIALDPATNRGLVALFGSTSPPLFVPSVGVIDASTNVLTATWSTLNAGGSNGVTLQNGKVFVSERDTNQVAVLDASSGAKLTDILVGMQPYGIGGSNGRVWVANFNSATDGVISATTNINFASPTGGLYPSLVAVAGDRAYISFYGGGIAVVDSNGAVLDSLTAVGDGSYGVALNAATNTLYATNRNTKQVLRLDTAGNVLASITAVHEPFALAVNPNTNHLFVAFATDSLTTGTPVNQVVVYDATTLATLTTLSPGLMGDAGGDGIAVMNNRLYVSANQAGTLAVFGDICGYVRQLPLALFAANP